MFGFGKKKPLTRDDFAEAAKDVERRTAQGEYVSAAQAAAALRKATEANNGAHTPLWAEAHFLEARTALMLGDYPKALEHMRAASDVHGDDDETIKLRLTNEMNLGDILSELGELDEAEAVHRRALEQRREFYGADHPGFGYGAESLGTVLLRKGRFAEASELARAGVEAFRSGEPHKLNATLSLWMLAEKAQHPTEPVLGVLSDSDRERLVNALASAPAYLFIDATIDLRWEVLALLEDRTQKMACLATIANQSEALDRHDDRLRALELYVDLAAEISPDDAAFALQGLALANEQAERLDDALAAYERALEIADGQRVQVQRNFALYLAQHGDADRAEELFNAALAGAEGELYARVSGAYGIFLHHHGRYDEAVARLNSCIEGLPPSHPDRLTADAHVQFARDGEACNCHIGMPVALSGLVRAVVAEYVADDLLDEVVVSPDFEISISLTRTASDDEIEAIQLATTEARRRIRELRDA